MIEDFLWWVAEKKFVCVCFCVFVCACVSVQAFWHLEPERVGPSGRAEVRSRHRNGGKTIVAIVG